MRPPGAAPTGAGRALLVEWVLPLALLGALNAAMRAVAVENPLRQLALYGAAIALLLSFARLRAVVPRAMVLLLALGGASVAIGERAELASGRLAAGDALALAVQRGTGLGRGVAEAVRSGLAGTPAAAPFQRYLARVDARSPEIDILASRLAAGCRSADHLCESAALLRFVTDEVLYRDDPRVGEDYVKSPQETLAANAGDCEDKSILLVSLLESLGNRTWLVFTRDHVWPLLCFDQPLDALYEEQVGRASPAERERYERAVAPAAAPGTLAARLAAADFIAIDGRCCYPVETTAPGSFFGARHEAREYLIAVDPLTRKTIDLRQALPR